MTILVHLFIVTKFGNVIVPAFTACFPQVALVAVPHPSGFECCSMLPVRNDRKTPREKPNLSDPPFTHWKRSFSNVSPHPAQSHPMAHTTSMPSPCPVAGCTRSDGSLVVANRDKVEKILAPPNCGAAVVYRLGYYNILLPKTQQSEE